MTTSGNQPKPYHLHDYIITTKSAQVIVKEGGNEILGLELRAKHLSYTSLNGAFATVEHLFDNDEYLGAQQFASPPHGLSPLS